MDEYQIDTSCEVDCDCGGVHINALHAKVKVMRMVVNDYQPGLVVMVDGLGKRRIGCAVLHPDDKDNYWMGVEHALGRCGLTKQEASAIYWAMMLQNVAKLRDQLVDRLVEVWSPIMVMARGFLEGVYGKG